jgi:hypothetical protein
MNEFPTAVAISFLTSANLDNRSFAAGSNIWSADMHHI